MKTFTYTNYLILLIIFIIIKILHGRYTDKLKKEEKINDNELIQKYLLSGQTLDESTKPILWIYIPCNYTSSYCNNTNSQNNTLELNNLYYPYLYLTVKSIISKCSDSFTICLIDDNSFKKLLPTWTINLNTIAQPIKHKVYKLAMMKLLYNYGGLICPISFLCMKDLSMLYEIGIQNNKMFVCETINNNITGSNINSNNFTSSLEFCGAPKQSEIINQIINKLQQIISTDFTQESIFLGEISNLLNSYVANKSINLIDGQLIGIKSMDNNQILIENLISSSYLKLNPNSYGILIPTNDIIKRNKYSWFSKLSHEQLYNSNTIIGKYLLVNNK